MPQPLSKVRTKGTSLSYGMGGPGAYVIDVNPELAGLAMTVIASWSHVEHAMMQIFVQLAGGSQSDAGALYLSLDGKGPKAAAINVLADRKLDQDNRNLLFAIMQIAKTKQAKRDKLAHGIWGASPNLPNALLLCDQIHMSDVRSMMNGKDKIFVYDAPDLTRIRKEMERVADWAGQFLLILWGSPANRNGQLYNQLCKEPEIAEILSRRANKD